MPAVIQQHRYQPTDYAPVCCNCCDTDNASFRYQLNISAIVTCNRCGLSYVNPRIKSELLARRQQKWAVQDTVDEERLRIAFEENTLKLYSRYLQWIKNISRREPQSILDIGCSVGAFLSQAKKEGWDSKGLEVGKASARYSMEQKNLQVENSSLYEHEYDDSIFDVISMLEVIEHLESPKDAVLRVKKWLKKEGVLFITTPNFDSLYRRIHGAKWWVINCEDEHIYFFTITTLKNLLEKCGFAVKLIKIRSYNLFGIVRLLLEKSKTTEQTASVNSEEINYYQARQGKEKIKAILGKIGLLGLVRMDIRFLDWLSSQRRSPLYGLGEQIIMAAVKKND